MCLRGDSLISKPGSVWGMWTIFFAFPRLSLHQCYQKQRRHWNRPAQVYVPSLQSCPTFRDPEDGSPPSNSVRGRVTGLRCHALLRGIFPTQGSNTSLTSPALAGRFFTTSGTWEPRECAKVQIAGSDYQGCGFSLFGVGLRICFSKKLPGDPDATGLETHVDKLQHPYSKPKFETQFSDQGNLKEFAEYRVLALRIWSIFPSYVVLAELMNPFEPQYLHL